MTVTLLAMALCFVLAAAGGKPDREPAQVAREIAAKALKVPEGQFQVKSVEPMEWPDSSLGCGRPGAMYLPAVTRGFRVLLEANGRTHTVHVAGNHGVLCDRPILGARLKSTMATEQIVALARTDLAARLNIPADEIETRLVRPTVWPDASLGCPKPDMVYAQVETPGYTIELTAKGKTYRYHADQRRVVACDD
ncbi:MAG TPA: hypothetical protein VG496_08900 [Myxococcales bacterium]|nr:hypothetical protein [Myxococcales bacterium]